MALASLALLLAQACARPEEKIASLRSHYKATLNGFTVLQEPAAGSLRQDVRLDLTLSREAEEGEDEEDRESLPGITVDVVQSGAGGREKRRWQVWVDGAGLKAGSGPEARVHPEMKDVDYQPGDRFAVEIRPVAPGERAKYREFSLS